MEISFTFSVFVQLFSIILGLLTGVILWIYSKKIHSPNKLLGSSFIFISLGLTISFLIESGLMLKVPHLYRLGNLFALLIMPLSYLYMRTVIYQRKLHKWDLIHTLPPLLYIIDFLPFFLLSSSEKIAILQHDLRNLNHLLIFDQGWLLPHGFHLPFRQVSWLFYWILQVTLLVQVNTSWSDETKKKNQNWLHWAQIITGLQSFFFLPYFISLLLSTQQYNWLTTTTVIAVFFGFISIYMFMRPDILYGIKGIMAEDKKREEKKQPVLHNNLSYMEKDEVERVMLEVEALMKDQALYLQHGLTISDLAEKVNVPNHQLSAIINREAALNFNEYLNQHRIQHCVGSMQRGEWEKYTLEALAYQCGFSNRNSFTISFKKFTGQTPSQYVKQLK